MDMKTGKPVGSVIPQENGDCIIRYGHNPDQPMQEDVVSLVCNPRTTVFKAAGIVCGRLLITDDDGSALSGYQPDPVAYCLKEDCLKEEGAEDV